MIHYPTRAEDRAEWARRIGGMDGIARWQIEDWRDHAQKFHVSPPWSEVLRICDVALGNVEMRDEDRPMLVEYREINEAFTHTVWAPKPERY